MPYRGAMSRRIAYRTCPLCEATCGLELHLEGDEIMLVRGDHDDVFSHGFLCPKGTALKQARADPDRLRRPLVRTGRAPTATWREVDVGRGVRGHRRAAPGDRRASTAATRSACTWATRARTTSPASCTAACCSRRSAPRNVFTASTVDQMPKQVSAGLMFGAPLSIPIPDIDRTDYLLMLGANPYASNGSL